mgnify:CR=1 FL=1
MYITDARHFLDDKGAIAPLRGPAKAMADFHAGVIAYATDFDDTGVTLPRCFKCKKGTVEAALAQDDAIVWHCPRCQVEGRISNWQGTLWDLSDRPDAASGDRKRDPGESVAAGSSLTTKAGLLG